MKQDKILVIGACGQIGVELTLALRNIYGDKNVIAADLKTEHPLLRGTGPYLPTDVLNKEILHIQIKKHKITQVYLLAAMLSAIGENNPQAAWQLNMQSLLNVLDIAKEVKLDKVFWPSSIAVFGNNSPKENCPQHTIIEPSTIYGISKFAGEGWCNYYRNRYYMDVRSLRYPGLISYKTNPGGGTTDYAVEIFHEAIAKEKYTCFLREDATLPMMYMPDAIRATIELMNIPEIKKFKSYNLAGFSFSPAELEAEIKKHIPQFQMEYYPDHRQLIADSWPASIDDSEARNEWNWKPEFDLKTMTANMLLQLRRQLQKEMA